MKDDQNNIPVASTENFSVETDRTERDLNNKEQDITHDSKDAASEEEIQTPDKEEPNLMVEQSKEMPALSIHKDAALKERRARAEKMATAALFVERRIEGWLEEARILKSKYPDFSLEKAVHDAVFMKMLGVGIPLEKAYKGANFDTVLSYELDGAALRYSDNIKARGARPVENGILSSGGVTLKRGVESLSRGQRADIAKRAMKGEKISF